MDVKLMNDDDDGRLDAYTVCYRAIVMCISTAGGHMKNSPVESVSII